MVTSNFEFYKRAIIYEVNIRQYTKEGTIAAFCKHIPRLKNMGVNVIWLMPIHPIGIINRKGPLGSYYAIQNYHEVNPEFGTKVDLIQLISLAHSNGIKVILDWVANHASTDNIWTIERPDYFIKNDDGSFYAPHGWTDVIQINHSNPDAHQALISEMIYWIETFDIDGFRADLAHLTPLDFWINARKQTHHIKSDLIWLAESENTDYFKAFDILYAWQWMHLTEDYCSGKNNIDDLITYIKSEFVNKSKSYYKLYFTTNHDENSWNGTEFEKYGNLSDVFTVMHFFLPFSVPLIYNGQEIPNQKRLLFFDRDPLHWDYPIQKNRFYQQLIEIRRHLQKHDQFDIDESHLNLLIINRRGVNSTIKAVLNIGMQIEHYHQLSNLPVADFRILMHARQMDVKQINVLPPGAFLIIEAFN